mmetsp:Transcript_10557/g.24558  ORF Transcript_10557/g.24558 Transcript_10557/m.24558 type:complete len:688 (+) Transcript_10557:264-2327(+)
MLHSTKVSSHALFLGLGMVIGVGVAALWWRRVCSRAKDVMPMDPADTVPPKMKSEHDSSFPTLQQSVGFEKLRQQRSSLRRFADKQELSDVFTAIAGEDKKIDFLEFSGALLDKLKLDLSAEEIRRVWVRLISNRKAKIVDPSKETIDFYEFRKGVMRVSFLRSIVTQLENPAHVNFVVAEDYDYAKSTNDNYGVKGRSFFGKYAGIRATLDYRYHVNYCQERQRWQDAAVDSVVARTAAQANPWVVFTCGPMGAGKGYALSWMSANGYFPIEDIVHVDPDHFKRIMPEWPEYTARGEEAGSLCHLESTFLQEIAQEAAMRLTQNVWVDGSLRDGPWFSKVFRDIRRRFPRYKIAIFEVTVRESVVRARIAKRAAETGRGVPEKLIKASLESVANSLHMLTPLADFVAKIENEDTPVLRAFIRVNDSGNWGLISDQFVQPAEMGQFPGSLAPIQLVSTSPELLILRGDAHPGKGGDKKWPCLRVELNLLHPKLAPLLPALRGAHPLVLAPLAPLSLDKRALALAGVPPEAETFSFVYPAAGLDWAALGDLDKGRRRELATSSCLAVLAGAFAYFDKDRQLCGISAVSNLLDGDPSSSNPTDSAGVKLLQFAAPLPFPREARAAFESAGRWHPVTLAALLAQGAESFAWVNPGEPLPGFEQTPPPSAFAYTLKGGGSVYFPVALTYGN